MNSTFSFLFERNLFRLIAISTLSCLLMRSKPAMACGLEDCILPQQSHRISPSEDVIVPAQWGWMAHDLALARAAARDGHRAETIRLTLNLDSSIRNALPQLMNAWGPDQILAMHEAMQALLSENRGRPLSPLPIDAATADRSPNAGTDMAS